MIPYFTDKNDDLEELIKSLKGAKVKSVLIDRLNLKPGVRKRVNRTVSIEYPNLASRFERTLAMRSANDYFRNVALKIIKLCKVHGIKHETCF
jgi:hypothetical protein